MPATTATTATKYVTSGLYFGWMGSGSGSFIENVAPTLLALLPKFVRRDWKASNYDFSTSPTFWALYFPL